MRCPCTTEDAYEQATDTTHEQGADAPEVSAVKPKVEAPQPKEIGGPKGLEPTRYGDWDVGGRCSDF